MAGWLLALSGVPWGKLINAVTNMKVLYDGMRSKSPKSPTQGSSNADDIEALRADISELQERIRILEVNEETRTELIAQMIRHEEALLRRLVVLTLALVVTASASIVALVVAVLW